MSDIRLSIPARPDYVHVLRSVAASAAAHVNLSLDDIEDLRLAVDEACAYLLSTASTAGSLTLSLTPTEDCLEIVTSVEGAPWNGPRDGPEQTLVWNILAALTDGAALENTEAGPVIRFSKRGGTAG